MSQVSPAMVAELAGRNRLINAAFDVWQRGAAFDAAGYTADRWRLFLGAGAAADVTREAFAPGQTDVPGEPRYFLRLHRTAAGTEESGIEQRVESARTLAGQAATLSFWAKASDPVTLNTFLRQHFGTGGAPSADVDSDPAAHGLTTEWQRFALTLTVDPIAGKNIGTDGNDYLGAVFALPAGEGAVTVDFANIQLEPGEAATEFECRSLGAVERRCRRYFQKRGDGIAFESFCLGFSNSGTVARVVLLYPRMRAAPNVGFSDTGDFRLSRQGDSTMALADLSAGVASPEACAIVAEVSSGLSAGEAVRLMGDSSGDAEIYLDAEI